MFSHHWKQISGLIHSSPFYKVKLKFEKELKLFFLNDSKHLWYVWIRNDEINLLISYLRGCEKSTLIYSYLQIEKEDLSSASLSSLSVYIRYTHTRTHSPLNGLLLTGPILGAVMGEWNWEGQGMAVGNLKVETVTLVKHSRCGWLAVSECLAPIYSTP